jgi:Na+-translocating ferredoxin:NAD+ oxidoreductase RnfG subunit
MQIGRHSLRFAILLAALGSAAPARAADFWKLGDLLRDFFASASKVAPRRVTLSDADAAEIEKKLGSPVKREYTIYLAEGEHGRAGYAIKDAEIGLHELIDYAVRFEPNGAVSRLEIMTYREPYGDEVRGERFRKQFIGKTANDPLVAGKDVDIISGATYSSKAMALGVKRDALVLQAALKNGL